MNVKHSLLRAGCCLSLAFLISTTPVIADDTNCSDGEIIQNGVYENINVTAGCVLINATVMGNINIQPGGEIISLSSIIDGNIQGDGVSRVGLFESQVGGSLQLTEVGIVTINASRFNGSIQLKSINDGLLIVDTTTEGDIQIEESKINFLRLIGNMTGGNIKVMKNRVSNAFDLNNNTGHGNLECFDNRPKPDGANNQFDDKKGQCKNL